MRDQLAYCPCNMSPLRSQEEACPRFNFRAYRTRILFKQYSVVVEELSANNWPVEISCS